MILVTGLAELVIGVTAMVLPVMLGAYLLYHGFMIIGFGSYLEDFCVKGYGWVIAGGVILLILSILILVNPFSFGTSAVVIMTGVALIIMGIVSVMKSLKLRKLHEHFKPLYR